jgi:hypothetical protein
MSVDQINVGESPAHSKRATERGRRAPTSRSKNGPAAVAHGGGGVLENSSANALRRAPGRPAKVSPELAGEIRKLFPRARSHRALQGRVYMIRAVRVLGRWRRSRWFGLGTRRRIKATVLAELGRIEDDRDLRTVARLIDAKPKSDRVAITFVRHWRLREGVVGNSVELADQMLDVARRYFKRCPRMEWADWVQTLWLLKANGPIARPVRPDPEMVRLESQIRRMKEAAS